MEGMKERIFDDLGDLTLVVGPDKAHYRVCSRTLARASGVFKAMLYGGFAEAKPSAAKWVVSLPEDNDEALGIVLDFVHGHYMEVPKSLGLEVLYKVAVITDKYDLAHLLAPRVRLWHEEVVLWLAVVAHDRLARRHRQQFMKALFISWVIGDETSFKNSLLCMAFYTAAGKDSSEQQDTEVALPDVVDQISIIRQQLIEKMLLAIELAINYLINPEPHVDRSACATILGYLFQNLAKVSLYPIPKPTEFASLPKTAASLFKKIKCVLAPTTNDIVSSKHMLHSELSLLLHIDTCGIDLATEAQLKHLKAQAQRTGLEIHLLPQKRESDSVWAKVGVKRQKHADA